MNMLSTLDTRAAIEIPPYVPSGNECRLFETAWTRRLPLLLK